MSENLGNKADSGETKTGDLLEQEKNEALRVLLKESVNFVQLDNRINGLFEEALSIAVAQFKKDPGGSSSGRGDIEALVSALKARTEGGTGVSGGDIVGGAPLDDVIDLIKALVEVLKGEKEFFMQIIRLIFCGCKG